VTMPTGEATRPRDRLVFEERSEQLDRITTMLDVTVTIAAFVTAVWLRNVLVDGEPVHVLSHLALLPFILALWGVSFAVFDASKSPRTTSALTYIWTVARAVTVALAVLLASLFLLKIQYVSRTVIAVFGVLAFVALVGIRLGVLWYFRTSLRRGALFHRVLIIGSGARARRLADTLLANSQWGIRIVGHLDPDPTRVGERVLHTSVLGTVSDISGILKDNVIDEVILAIPRAMIPDVDKIAHTCEEEGVKLSLMADVFDVHVARTRLVDFAGIPLLILEPVAQDEWKLLVKRLIDLAFALAIVPLLLPVTALIAIAIKLDSPGSVFFTQERVGLHKRRFRMLKFRTMVADADRLQAQLEDRNEAQGPIFKIARDPRITRVGGFLRRTSLDELPQVFHVLTGEMSLVGPRPMSLRDVNRFDHGLQRKRFSVKPGLTCIWQVSGRSQLPFSKWLELDLHYIEHWSLALDFKILLKTVPAVLRGTGAV
jgi:exopolysaccharide biosynthesis polyprenyl glycosylphosphotransferase